MNFRQILIHVIYTFLYCNGFVINIHNLKKDLLSILTGSPTNQNPQPNIHEISPPNQQFQFINSVDSKPTQFITNGFVKPTTQIPDAQNKNNISGSSGSGGIFLENHSEDFTSTRRPIVFPDLDYEDKNVETLFRENILKTKFHEKKQRKLQIQRK